MNTATVIKNVKKIEIKTRKLVDGLIQGAYHSIFKGRGIEFSEVRPYQIGDDIRTIDWNVTARQYSPYVKEFIEERDLTIFVLFDISSSNEFGSSKGKKDTAIELIASIMFAAIRNNDKIGLGLFTDRVENYYPPRKGKRHVLKLIRDMLMFEPKNKTTDINRSLSFFASIIKKRSTIFIISDFMSDDFSRPLKLLKNRHDVILININDKRELEMPDVGFIELEDEETGEHILVNTSDKNFQKKYREIVEIRRKNFSTLLRKAKIDLIQLRNDEPFELPLRNFFKTRLRRIAR